MHKNIFELIQVVNSYFCGSLRGRHSVVYLLLLCGKCCIFQIIFEMRKDLLPRGEILAIERVPRPVSGTGIAPFSPGFGGLGEDGEDVVVGEVGNEPSAAVEKEPDPGDEPPEPSGALGGVAGIGDPCADHRFAGSGIEVVEAVFFAPFGDLLVIFLVDVGGVQPDDRRGVAPRSVPSVFRPFLRIFSIMLLDFYIP